MTTTQYNSAVAHSVRHVARLLASGSYADLEQLTGAKRLRARDIEGEVNEYGRTLVMPPETAYDNIDVIPIRGSEPQAYSVRFRLYTKEEGQSDLEVQLTLMDRGTGEEMGIQLDGILVA